MRIKLSDFSLYRQELMGIAAVSIVFMHSISYGVLHLNNVIDRILGFWGTFGVDIFLILSGFGIFLSLTKEQSFLLFFKKRTFRVLIPYWIVLAVFCFIQCQHSVLKIALKFSTLYCWFYENDGYWYISFIIVMYLISFFLFGVGKIKGHSIFIIIIVSLLLTFIISVYYPDYSQRYIHFLKALPAYWVGCGAGYLFYNNKEREFGIRSVVLLFIISVSVYIVERSIYTFAIPLDTLFRILCSLLFVIIQVYFFMLCNRNSIFTFFLSFFRLLGEWSLEIYLLHFNIIEIIIYYNKSDLFQSHLFYLVFFLFTILCSYLVHEITKRIFINGLNYRSIS